MPRLDRSPLVMSPFVMLCLTPLCCLVLVTNVSAQNGFTANELTTGITPGNSIDALWADGNDHRWKVAVTSSAAFTFTEDMAFWPCTSVATQTGGIVYASTPPFSGAVNLETCLSIPTTFLPGVPLLIGSSAPEWGAENLDIQNYALVTEMTAAGSPATPPSLNYLVAFTTSNPTTAELAGTGNTTNVEGICVGSNCGTAGNVVQIAREGVAGCKFYNATTAGDYVQASTTTGGECQDAGSSYPTNGKQVIGRALANGSAGTVVNVILYSSGVLSLNLSGTDAYVQTTSANNGSPPTSGDVVTYDAHANTQDSGTPLTNLALKSGIYGTWGAFQPTLTVTTLFAQWTVPAAITGVSLDLALTQTPAGCSPAGTFAIYDTTASATVFSITLANGTGTYSTTGSPSVASGHVLRTKMTTAAASCTTNPQNALITFTYQMQ